MCKTEMDDGKEEDRVSVKLALVLTRYLFHFSFSFFYFYFLSCPTKPSTRTSIRHNPKNLREPISIHAEMKFYFPFSFFNPSVSCIVFLIPTKRQEYVVTAVGADQNTCTYLHLLGRFWMLAGPHRCRLGFVHWWN